MPASDADAALRGAIAGAALGAPAGSPGAVRTTRADATGAQRSGGIGDRGTGSAAGTSANAGAASPSPLAAAGGSAPETAAGSDAAATAAATESATGQDASTGTAAALPDEGTDGLDANPASAPAAASPLASFIAATPAAGVSHGLAEVLAKAAVIARGTDDPVAASTPAAARDAAPGGTAGISGTGFDLAALSGALDTGKAQAPGGGASYAVRTPVDDPGFGADVSRQLVYLAKTGAQSAELTLQPANLGPVSVSIQMNGLQTTVAISASHEATRTALREALPQLSALFQQSGLQLAGAQVGDGSERSSQQDSAPRDSARWNSAAVAGSKGSTAIPVPASTGGRGLIDTFV
jgi:flagellar hook-length control protein FliK